MLKDNQERLYCKIEAASIKSFKLFFSFYFLTTMIDVIKSVGKNFYLANPMFINARKIIATQF